MTPLLSIARLGFDKEPDAWRSVIADLNGIAADIGSAISDAMSGPVPPSADVERRLQVLRAHRFWLMEQAEKFQQRLDANSGQQSERAALVHAAASLGCDVRRQA